MSFYIAPDTPPLEVGIQLTAVNTRGPHFWAESQEYIFWALYCEKHTLL